MNLPVVKQGEEINSWLSRSVPALVEMHQLNTEQANRLAKQAWQQINGGGDLVTQMTGEDAPTFEDESSWGENVVEGESWPDPQETGQAADAQWPDPFSQEDFDALVDNPADPTAQPDPAAPTDPTAQPDPAAPGDPTMQAPPAAPPTTADGVAALLSTLTQLTTIVEGLQGIAKVMGGLAPQAQADAKKPLPDDAEDAEEEDTEEDAEDADTDEDAEPEPVAEAADAGDPTQPKTEKPAPFGAKPPTEKPVKPAQFGAPATEEKPDPKKKKPNPFKGGDFLAVGNVPSTGYVIAVAPERARTLPEDLISAKAVSAFMTQNADLWDANLMGGRVDEQTGEVTLAAFRHAETEAKAIQHCAALGVDTYINLNTGEALTVPVTKSLDWVDEQGFHGPNLIRRLGDYRDPGDLAVKSLGDDRFGGYLCLWGNPSAKDLSGEWFTRSTADMTSVFDVLGKLPAFYHHAGDDVVKSAVVGLIDEMEDDDAGLWVEAQARLAKAYRQYVQPLIVQKSLGWSSGALPRARRVAKTGEIMRWPIIEGSLTPTPFEWRNSVDWPVERITKAYELAGLSTVDLDLNNLLKGKTR